MSVSFDECDITRTIIEYSSKDLVNFSKVDIIIVGAGPSGLTAGYYLAKRGLKTLILERRLSLGGGIGGGGMLFHKIVASVKAREILDEMNCRYEISKENENLIVMDASELLIKLGSAAINSGAKLIFGISVEDVIYRDNPFRIEGVVIQWSAVHLSGLHVDPLMIRAKAVIDATGHDAEVISVVAKKIKDLGISVLGEKSMYSVKSEDLVVERTGKIIEGLYATGMAVAAYYNLPRMGPIFSSMLLSGKKIAEIVISDITR